MTTNIILYTGFMIQLLFADTKYLLKNAKHVHICEQMESTMDVLL